MRNLCRVTQQGGPWRTSLSDDDDQPFSIVLAYIPGVQMLPYTHERSDVALTRTTKHKGGLCCRTRTTGRIVVKNGPNAAALCAVHFEKSCSMDERSSGKQLKGLEAGTRQGRKGRDVDPVSGVTVEASRTLSSGGIRRRAGGTDLWTDTAVVRRSMARGNGLRRGSPP